MSFLVLYRLKENLIPGLLLSGEISERTCDPLLTPDAQALPPLQATPNISKLKSSISEIPVSGKWQERTVYKLLSISVVHHKRPTFLNTSK